MRYVRSLSLAIAVFGVAILPAVGHAFSCEDADVTPRNKGRLTRVTHPGGETRFGYNVHGAVTVTQEQIAEKIFHSCYEHTLGKPTALAYPSGMSVRYDYAGKIRIRAMSLDGVPLVGAIRYLPFSNTVTGFLFANSEPYVRVYDQDGFIKSITLGPAAGAYDDFAQSFAYDGVDRLISATVTGVPSLARKYVYDGVNRIQTDVGGQVTNYMYPNTSNRLSGLTGATQRTYSYDAAGYMTSLGGIALAYDGRGRLKQAGSTTYIVNGLGQRVAKTVGGAARYFVYDVAGHLLGEYDALGNPIQETVWLYDTPIAVVKPKAGGGREVFNVFTDYLDTPRVIANQQNQIVWRWDAADPFGVIPPNEDPSGLGTFEFNGAFPGMYRDKELGTYYNYLRDCYIPDIGRYCQSDPIGLAGGISTYGYANGNPLTNTDPRGLSSAKARVMVLLAQGNVAEAILIAEAAGLAIGTRLQQIQASIQALQSRFPLVSNSCERLAQGTYNAFNALKLNPEFIKISNTAQTPYIYIGDKYVTHQHFAVRVGDRVYDAFTGANGMLYSQYLNMLNRSNNGPNSYLIQHLKDIAMYL
jgi:RHS repeat-associated protein